MSEPLSQRGSGAETTSILNLQLHDLLEKSNFKMRSRMSKAQDALQELRQLIEQIPPRDKMNISTAEETLRQNDNVIIPFPEPRPSKDAQYLVSYDKPEAIDCFQSFAHDKDMIVDVVITMPLHIFQDKDFLNYRYFYKRAYYIACLAAGIQKSKGSQAGLKFASQNDNFLQPVIIIELKHGQAPKIWMSKIYSSAVDEDTKSFSEETWRVQIVLAAPDHLFPIAKTLPAKNCIRRSNVDACSVETSQPSTSFYNATIRSECSTISYLRLFGDKSLKSEAFKDGCVLGGIWLRRRGLQSGLTSGGFGQFEWNCLMTLLLRKDESKSKPVFPKGYSSYQLFKATLQFIAASNLSKEPLIIGFESLELVDQTGPVFFDGEQGLNVLYKMTEWSYKLLRHEAEETIQTLKESLIDRFRCTFISKIDDPFYRFDYCFSVAVVPTRSFSDPSDEVTQCCQKVYDDLSRGLSDRAKLIHMRYLGTPTWTPESMAHSSRRNVELIVGLVLNPEKCWRTVDHGPSADNQAASREFRAFWGEKAELRRFKDGSILESVVWDSEDPKQNVLDQVISYVLRRHTIVILGSVFNQFLRHSPNSVNPITPYLPIITSFQNLEEKIRGIDKLPLQIRQITAASPALCFASLEIPILNSDLGNMSPADIYVQFEGSARWPNDMVAIQRTKIAFLLKLGELLEVNTNGWTTRLGLENESSKLLNRAFLDIFDPLGAAFRLRIHHEHELGILQNSMKKESSSFRRLEIASAISTYKRDFLQRPVHTEMVRTLSTRFPVLSPSIRLMKKWRDCHLLSPHIEDELIELMTIKTFVHPHPWPVPNNVTTGFLRTLAWVANWDWRTEPLIIDFNHELSAQNIEDINLRYKGWRKVDSGMNRVAMFVASNIDPDGVSWTEQGPSKVAAARFSSLATSAHNLAKKQGLNLNPETLFATSTADYDFIVHINHAYVQNDPANKRKRHSFKNLALQSSNQMSSARYHSLVQSFLTEITKMYSSSILFFYNAHNTLFIAGIWNPQTGPRNWKVNVGYSSMPFLDSGSNESKIAINRTATLHDIARLGGNLVSKIEVKE